MSSASDNHPADNDAQLECEPDEIPVRFLTMVAGGVTAVTLVMVFIAVWLFDARTAYELQAKGYSVTKSVPVDASGADGE